MMRRMRRLEWCLILLIEFGVGFIAGVGVSQRVCLTTLGSSKL